MGSMSGIWQIAVNPTSLSEGSSIAAYLVDGAGSLLSSTAIGGKQRLDTNDIASHLDGAAYAAGVDYLMSSGAVDESGNWQPLNINAAGELLVNANVSFTAEHLEDSASASGDSLIGIAAVRQDVLATDTSTDGDYSFIKVNALGEQYVHDTDVKAQLVSANSTLTNIKSDTASIVTNTSNIHSDLQTLTKLEDAAASSGDAGIQALLVRQDVLASSTSTDGDYGSFKSNAAGELYVSDTTMRSLLTALSKSEDAAHSSGDQGIQALAVRKDAQGSNVGSDGDYSSLLTWSEGSLKVVDIANGSIRQTQVSVANTATKLPTTPLANRKSLMIQNAGSASIWIGSATVTTTGATTGIEVPKSSFMELEVGPAFDVYGIVSTTSQNANVLELA